ncbi:MAG: hypothetical protein KGZ25_05385 [Planctomycetes bacterium]|nr:hypothetical protein [Planctomycetota bacterium]
MGGPSKVEKIGVPVRGVNWVRTFAGRKKSGEPCILITMGQHGAAMFVLQVDPASGDCQQFYAPIADASHPTTSYWSDKHRCLFIGSTPGHLFRFTPGTRNIEDLGKINPGDANFPCRIAEDPEGLLYVGSSPGCDLTSYDPATNEFTRHGRMDETDKYFYPFCGADGTVAGLVKMVRPHVVAFNPETGEHRPLGPVADTDTGEGHVNLRKGPDNLLYIDSHGGIFRVVGTTAVPLEELDFQNEPEWEGQSREEIIRSIKGENGDAGPPTLPGGSTFKFLDGSGDGFQYRQLQIQSPSGETRQLELNWEGDGTGIFLVRKGPDDNIYGSSILPLHLFRHVPSTGLVEDLGACSTSGGELYSMGSLDGKLYMCAYPGARLSVYDPERPCRFGIEKESNPRELGRMDEVAYRPRDMLCGPAGKVWTASIPDYGMWGGTLAWFDPRSEQFGSHRHIFKNCSPISLAYIPEQGLIAVGFTIAGGSGTEARVGTTGLALWDPEQDELSWKGDLGLEIISVMDLCEAGEGRTYAIVHLEDEEQRAELMLLDLPEKQILDRVPLGEDTGWPLEVSLRGERNFVVGATRKGIFRVEKGTTEVEMLWICEEKMCPTAGGALADGKYFFAAEHRLCALPID